MACWQFKVGHKPQTGAGTGGGVATESDIVSNWFCEHFKRFICSLRISQFYFRQLSSPAFCGWQLYVQADPYPLSLPLSLPLANSPAVCLLPFVWEPWEWVSECDAVWDGIGWVRRGREAFEQLRQLLKSCKRDFWGCFPLFLCAHCLKCDCICSVTRHSFQVAFSSIFSLALQSFEFIKICRDFSRVTLLLEYWWFWDEVMGFERCNMALLGSKTQARRIYQPAQQREPAQKTFFRHHIWFIFWPP